MTSLREHINLQDQPNSLPITEGDLPAIRKPSKIRFNGHGKFILAIGLVAVVAVVAILAVVIPGYAGLKDGGAAGQEGGHPGQFIVQVISQPEPSQVVKEALPPQETPPAVPKNEPSQNDDVTRNIIFKKDVVEGGTEFCETPACEIAAAQISEAIDISTNPCDDFYQFACGGWMEKHPVPEKGRVGVYDEVVNTVNRRIMLILESEADPGDPAPLHMTRTMYSTCIDIEAMEDLGVAPLLSSLDLQGGWPMVLDTWDPSHFDLQSALANLRGINVHPLVAVGVDKNIHNTTRNIIYLNAGTVPLGVTIMSSPTEMVVNAYKTFMNTAAKYLRDQLVQTVTDEEIALQVDEVIQFEIVFSKIVINAAIHATDHAWLTNVTEIQEYTDAGTPGMFNWLSFFKQIFSKPEIIITTTEPILSFNGPFWSDLSNLLNATNSKTLANAIGWWWLYEMSQETTQYLRDAELDFIQALGTPPLNRSSHCRVQTNTNLAFAVSRDYVDKFFSPTAKKESSLLVEDLRTSFGSLLDENTWMLPEDLAVAKDKLAAIEAFVAYPDWILDDDELTLAYAGMELTNKQQYNNILKIGRWFDFHTLQLLREEPVRSFAIPPTIVNAYYKAEDNAITVTASILQNPYFAHDSLAALNYGGIGFFMGHEMTHGFDNIGRLYDKDGNLVQWWSNETIKAYNERAQCFVDQYNNFYPPELIEVGLNVSVNGQVTLSENIADNGGIREAYRAYQLYVDRHGEEPRLPGLDEFSPDQLFYLGFAYTWCSHESSLVMMEQLLVDAHSPERFRVLGPLSNDEDFSRVWNCPAESPMNRGDDRCVLW